MTTNLEPALCASQQWVRVNSTTEKSVQGPKLKMGEKKERDNTVAAPIFKEKTVNKTVKVGGVILQKSVGKQSHLEAYTTEC